MSKESKYWIFGGLGLVVAAILVWYYIKSGDPKNGTVDVKEPVLDANGNPVLDANGKPVTQTTQFNPRPYTDALKEVIYDWTTYVFNMFRDTKPFEDLANLSDGEVIKVAQDWNQRYYKLDSESLLQAIKDEEIPSELLNTITARFSRLNLS